MHRSPLILVCLAGLGLATACGTDDAGDTEPETPIAEGRRYVESRAFRRTILENSLEDSDNLYSRRRLDYYAVDGDESWESLPVHRPSVSPVTTEDLGSFDRQGRRAATTGETVDRWTSPWTHEGLMALGERAFHHYPLRPDHRLAPVAADRHNAEQAGFWVTDRVGGLAAEPVDDGREMVAWTCSTCHASTRPTDPDRLVAGRSNADLKISELFRLAGDEDPPADDWLAGQIDSSRDATVNPTAIPDLRAVRHQSHLHAAATIENSLMALTVRIETLLIVSRDQQVRPPRQMAFALAYYLWHLQPPTTPDPPAAGRQVFDAHCSRCHGADGTVAAPVDYRQVGTDPAAARSPARSTGRYRIPSLAGVGDRPYLLHDGSVRSLETFLDPDRRERVPGHPYGLDLTDEKRRALLEFLRAIPEG